MDEERLDEDALVSSIRTINLEDNDPTDELPDFRFLAAFAPNAKSNIPKRGEKDFEPHGTRQQDSVLEASRQAMHDALSYTRTHLPKTQARAWYLGEEVFERDVETSEQIFRNDEVRGRGLEIDHVIMVESASGTHYRTLGKTSLRLQRPRIWLLPEEALYLVERGNLDLWWPSRPYNAVSGQSLKDQTLPTPDPAENDDDDDDGLPLSFQAAYALLIGEDNEKGKTSLDRYTVYANLKRTGYIVLRAQPIQKPLQKLPTLPEQISNYSRRLFSFLFDGYFQARPFNRTRNGPLVRPGLYRSYNDIYKMLEIVPRHQPSEFLEEHLDSPELPFKVVFDVWKPARIPTFAKSDPGLPDFRVAVVSSRETDVPTLTQLATLIESTPWDPPDAKLTGPGKRYQRLKHGWRNVIIAVVDQGIISYLRFGEAAFGEERLYEGFDRQGSGRGGKKRGGFRGRGRGRGRRGNR